MVEGKHIHTHTHYYHLKTKEKQEYSVNGYRIIGNNFAFEKIMGFSLTQPPRSCLRGKPGSSQSCLLNIILAVSLNLCCGRRQVFLLTSGFSLWNTLSSIFTYLF
jgi:hypothetical protein